MTDRVGFGEGPRDREKEELKKLVTTALVEGVDVINDWETNFLKSVQLKLNKGFALSTPMRESLDKIRKKLQKEGLIDED